MYLFQLCAFFFIMMFNQNQGLLEETGRATPFQWKMNWRPTLSIRINILNLGIFGQTLFSKPCKSCLVFNEINFGPKTPKANSVLHGVKMLSVDWDSVDWVSVDWDVTTSSCTCVSTSCDVYIASYESSSKTFVSFKGSH